MRRTTFLLIPLFFAGDASAEFFRRRGGYSPPPAYNQKAPPFEYIPNKYSGGSSYNAQAEQRKWEYQQRQAELKQQAEQRKWEYQQRQAELKQQAEQRKWEYQQRQAELQRQAEIRRYNNSQRYSGSSYSGSSYSAQRSSSAPQGYIKRKVIDQYGNVVSESWVREGSSSSRSYSSGSNQDSYSDSYSSGETTGYYDSQGRLVRTKTPSAKGNAYIGIYFSNPSRLYINGKQIGDHLFKGGYHYIADDKVKKGQSRRHDIRIEKEVKGETYVYEGYINLKYGKRFEFSTAKIKRTDWVQYDYYRLGVKKQESLDSKKSWLTRFEQKTDDIADQIRRDLAEVEKRINDVEDATLKNQLKGKLNANRNAQNFVSAAKAKLNNEFKRRNNEAHEWFDTAKRIYREKGRKASKSYQDKMRQETLPGQLAQRTKFDEDFESYLASLLSKTYTVAKMNSDISAHRAEIARQKRIAEAAAARKKKISDYENSLAKWQVKIDKFRSDWKAEIVAKYVTDPKKTALEQVQKRRAAAKESNETAGMLEKIFAAEERSIENQVAERQKAIDSEDNLRAKFVGELKTAYRGWFEESLDINYGNRQDNAMWDKENERRDQVTNGWKKSFPTSLNLSPHSVEALSAEGKKFFNWLAEKKQNSAKWQEDILTKTVTTPLDELGEWKKTQHADLAKIKHDIVRKAIAPRVERERALRNGGIQTINTLLSSYSENWDKAAEPLEHKMTDQLLKTGKVDLEMAENEIAPILKNRENLERKLNDLISKEDARRKEYTSVGDMAAKETARYPIARRLPKACGDYNYVQKLDARYHLRFKDETIAYIEPGNFLSATCHNDTLGILVKAIETPDKKTKHSGRTAWFQFKDGELGFSHIPKDEDLTALWWSEQDDAFVAAANVGGIKFSYLLEEDAKEFDEGAERKPPTPEKGLFLEK